MMLMGEDPDGPNDRTVGVSARSASRRSAS